MGGGHNMNGEIQRKAISEYNRDQFKIFQKFVKYGWVFDKWYEKAVVLLALGWGLYSLIKLAYSFL